MIQGRRLGVLGGGKCPPPQESFCSPQGFLGGGGQNKLSFGDIIYEKLNLFCLRLKYVKNFDFAWGGAFAPPPLSKIWNDVPAVIADNQLTCGILSKSIRGLGAGSPVGGCRERSPFEPGSLGVAEALACIFSSEFVQVPNSLRSASTKSTMSQKIKNHTTVHSMVFRFRTLHIFWDKYFFWHF